MIQYRLQISPEKTFIQIGENGSKRILYLDTFKLLAKEEDKAIFEFLKRKYRLNDPIQQMEATLETLQLVCKTGRFFYKNQRLMLEKPTKLYWKETKGTYAAVLDANALEECQHVAFGWALSNESIIPIATDVAWKWVELFRKGPIFLDGVQKKRFLEEDPPVIVKQSTLIPELILTDSTGCFANLRTQDIDAENDLIEAGFVRKKVGTSDYYCSGDKVHSVLKLLIDIGWKIYSSSGKPVLSQTSICWEVKEEKEKLALDAIVTFKEQKLSLKNVLKTNGFFVEAASFIGLLDRKKFEGIQGEIHEDKILVRKGALSFLEGDKVQWSDRLQTMVEGLKNGELVEDVSLGSSFQGKLLPYQKKGVNWLAFLKKWGFSGLLADEMGLGKTVQVLAFFSHIRTNLPLLVVAPSSLLFQWKQEIHRFLPDMPVTIHAGPSRLKELSQIQGVIVTSYAILRMDEKLLSSIHFEVIVLDESNAIKTTGTLTAQAAIRLNGHFKVSLTGTPMENRFDELVSQFQFLMPDLPLKDPKQIKPFILRRKKKDVEIQLPEKIEQISWVDMNETQESLYQTYLSQFKSGLLTKVEKEGISTHRMEVLEAILRLRQICIDPRLIGESFNGAKIERLLEDIDDRKSLVFSQFTSMLQCIAKELDARGKKYIYLDGDLPSHERARLVSQFQVDPESSIFLLSLKAGGVGLNLTAAENVFIMDPWWNDSVEQQAIDRAHRIGQKRSVFIKRYITPNTIEEKMLQLKEKKRTAAELLLDGEEMDLLELFL